MAEQNEAIQKQLAADKEARERSYAEYEEKMKGKPTPTQEENDRAMLGEHVLDKEDDGSGPDQPTQQKNLEAQQRGGYQTRAIPRQPQQQRPTPTENK